MREVKPPDVRDLVWATERASGDAPYWAEVLVDALGDLADLPVHHKGWRAEECRRAAALLRAEAARLEADADLCEAVREWRIRGRL